MTRWFGMRWCWWSLFCMLLLGSGALSCHPTPSTLFELKVLRGKGSGFYQENQRVVIEADAPPPGQVFRQWIGANSYIEELGDARTIVTMPRRNIQVEAGFAKAGTTHLFSLTVINGTGSGEYTPGTAVALAAKEAPAGLRFDRWTGDIESIQDARQSKTTLTMPNYHIRISAAFLPKTTSNKTFGLTVFNGEGSGAYKVGQSVSVTAKQAPVGYRFDRWTGDIETLKDALQPLTSLTMPARVIKISAAYVQETTPGQRFTLTVVGGKGSGVYTAKQNVVIAANAPPSGYRFDGWKGDIAYVKEPKNAQTTLVMPAKNARVEAAFVSGTLPSYALKVTQGTGSGSYRAGETISIQAEPALPGSKFAGWVGDVDVLNDPGQAKTSLVMPARAVAIEATYKSTSTKTYRLDVRGGTGSGNYPAGTSVTVEAKPGHPSIAFVEWKGSGFANVRNAKTTFVMPSRAIEIRATFRQTNATKVRALMATDFLVDRDLWKHRKNDFAVWRKTGINTIYAVVDLPTGCAKARPYILAGREETKINAIVVQNATLIHEEGFHVMVVLGNEPSVRSGLSSCMNGLGRKSQRLQDLYSSRRLQNEKAAWKDLYAKLGTKVYGAILYLEPSIPESRAFVKSLGAYIRGLGYKGRLYSNGIGNGRWGGDTQLQIFRSTSINFMRDWRKSNQHLRNSDGMMTLNASTASKDLSEMTRTPGPHGYILWFSDYRGGARGRGKLLDWHWKYIHYEAP